MTIQAILWDMDGTLIDSEPLHEQALRAAMAQAGITAPADLHDRVVGMSADAVYAWLRQDHGLELAFPDWISLKYEHYMKNVEDIRLIPQAIALWQAAALDGIQQAIVSNSDRLIVDTNLRQTGFAFAGFKSVSRNDVRRGKPEPEPYLRAAWLLEVPTENCIVIEDSVTGARAGKAAGMRTYLLDPLGNSKLPGIVAVSNYCQIASELGLLS